MTRILGVNGIHTWSWSKHSFTDILLDALDEAFEVIDVHMPRFYALTWYLDVVKRRRAKMLVAVARDGDNVVAHSAGCMVTLYAMQMGVKFNKVFFFAAAAPDNVVIPENGCKLLYNIHSGDDRALMLGGLLPNHDFGSLGLAGYAGNDTRVINIAAPGMDHTDYVKPKNLCKWVNFITGELE